MKVNAFLRALGVTAGVVLSLLAVASASSATPARADVLAGLAADGIDVDQLPPGGQVVGDEIRWERQTDMGILSTGLGTVCPSGYFCLWKEPGFIGTLWFTNDRGVMHDLRNYGFNDVANGWKNRTAYDAIWYVNVSGSPNPSVCVNSGASVPAAPVTQEDRASLAYLYSNASTC